MRRTKWVVRTEDTDMYNIDELGIFSDLEGAIAFVREEIKEEIEGDEDGYGEWLYGNDYDERQHPMGEYVNEKLQELDRLIQEMKESMQRGKGEISFEWIITIYFFNKVPVYS